MVVRAGLAGDLKRVVELERGAELAPHWNFGEYEGIVAGGAGVARCLMVAEMSAEVVGFAVGKVVAGIGEIENVVVADEWRGRGVGGDLCEAVVEWARGMGAGAMELEVREGNVAGRALYRRLGFEETGRRKGYYRGPAEDAVLMTKGLE